MRCALVAMCRWFSPKILLISRATKIQNISMRCAACFQPKILLRWLAPKINILMRCALVAVCCLFST
jgi:hypothetical protein